MKTSILQENFNKGLSIVKPATLSRPTLPVLANVLLTAQDGRLKLSTTDLELSISAWIGAKVEVEGMFTVPMKMLGELVKNLSPERIDLELNTRTQTLHLECGGTKVDLKGITADEFPLIQGVENGLNVTLSAEMLRDMVNEVADSAAKVDNRPVLTSIYTNFDGNVVTMASADGYRLTVRKDVLDYEVAEPFTALIPVRALQEVAKMIGKGKKALATLVTLKFDLLRHRMEFDLGDIQVVSNLMEGIFPMYMNIVPKSHNTATIVYRDEFLCACKKARVFAKDSSNTTRLNINPSTDGGPGTMTVSAKSIEMGEIDSMIDASVKGEAMNAAYNIEYLIDVLNAIGEDQVMLETIDFAEPLVMRGVGQDKLFYVLMPMLISK